ncbi:MAG: NADH-quinone oxidoreductase subunit N [Bacteroidota bacterium]|nr:NADH-quinone oxidoreductase subunit N [Bacteroidota bacterium]
MTSLDFLCLSPLIILAAAPILIMLAVTISRNFRFTYLFSLVMFALSFISLFAIMPHVTHRFGTILVLDGFGIMFLGIIYIASILITILSYDYLKEHRGEKEEYFIMLFIAVFGASVLVMAEHFVTFFLGLETLSISLYVLIAYLKSRDECVEGGVKFLVIASLSTAFLLFGMGLIYAETGTMNFRALFPFSGEMVQPTLLMIAGFGLMLAGIGFKLAVVPFHMWTPDVYQGAPVPVTTFIATVSKGSVLALALRLMTNIQGFQNKTIFILISAISILSMFTGNLLALNQTSLKRILAYSSIAHLGYLLITLLTGTSDGIHAAIFYVAAYVITTLGAFSVISVLSVCERDTDNIVELKGLFWTNPWIATVMTLALLSLAGIPITAGFISKFYLVLAGVKSGLWILAFILIINSVISLYYYLRVVKTMFIQTDSARKVHVSPSSGFVLAVVAAGIIFLGILPAWLTDIVDAFGFW